MIQRGLSGWLIQALFPPRFEHFLSLVQPNKLQSFFCQIAEPAAESGLLNIDPVWALDVFVDKVTFPWPLI